MAKGFNKKQSKRMKSRLKFKIEKKVKDHRRKMKKESKKKEQKPPKKKQIITVPNKCPFKENLMTEVDKMLKEKQEQRKLAFAESRKQKNIDRTTARQEKALKKLVEDAQRKVQRFSAAIPDAMLPNPDDDEESTERKKRMKNTLYKEFKQVVNAADVILEVVDARDPLGTRCKQVEELINEHAGRKRLVLILNKADLVPLKILEQWIKYFRLTMPAIAFKATTQEQVHKLSRHSMKLAKHKENIMHGSRCVGAELLMSILANYCRNKDIKTSITVGVVGVPNVGKSSLINSLKRSRACNVGAVPGVTRTMQEIQLDKHIKLLDSPGIVTISSYEEETAASLRNTVGETQLVDPIEPAIAILRRCDKKSMCDMYKVDDYRTPEEFFAKLAMCSGKFNKGGIPNLDNAARIIIQDWNTGKIKYHTLPPVTTSNLNSTDETLCHVGASIITDPNAAKEFDLEKFEAMESEAMAEFAAADTANDDKEDSDIDMDEESVAEEEQIGIEKKKGDQDKVMPQNLVIEKLEKKLDRIGRENRKKKNEQTNPEMQLEGNQQINRLKKQQFKKQKKNEVRKEKVIQQLAVGLENYQITSKNDSEDDSAEDNYNFATDYH